MDFTKIIKFIEEFLYEIAVWIILLPKTFFRITFKPHKIVDYVNEEFNKEREHRFDEYMPPILIFILLIIFPYSGVAEFIGTIKAASYLANNDTLSYRFFSSSLESKIFLISVFLLAGPLGTSLVLAKMKGLKISKTNLNRFFYIQCYCFTPSLLFLLPFVFIFVVSGGRDLEELNLTFYVIALVSANLFIWHLLLTEMFAIKNELQVKNFKAIMIFTASMIVSYALAIGLELFLLLSLMFMYKLV